MIDGEPAPDLYAHEHQVPGRPDERVLLMVHDDDDVELARWSTKGIAVTARPAPYGRSGAYGATMGHRASRCQAVCRE